MEAYGGADSGNIEVAQLSLSLWQLTLHVDSQSLNGARSSVKRACRYTE